MLVRVFATAVFCVVLAGCGGGSSGSSGGLPPVPPVVTPTPIPTPAGASEVVTANVVASAGGTLTLPSGTALAIAPGALPADGAVQIATIPHTALTPRNPDLQTTGSAVHVTFFSGTSNALQRARRPLDVGSGVTFVLPSSYAKSVDAFTLPIIRITTGDGNSVDLSQPPSIDANGNWMIHLPSTATLSKPIVTAIDVFIAHLSPALKGLLGPGLRYYDPTAHAWTTAAPPSQSSTSHPLLLLHGIRSSVEDAFPPDMVDRLRENGAYDVVIGYDYNWLKPATKVEPPIAAAVSALGYPSIDIMAHSYGSVVAMDLAGDANLHVLSIQNLVLAQGPLDGALIHDPNYLASVLVSLGYSSKYAYALVNALNVFSPNWLQQFAKEDPGVAQIVANVNAASNSHVPLRVIKLAGTVTPAAEAAAFLRLTGTAPEVGDGIIGQASALRSLPVGATPATQYAGVDAGTFVLTFPVDHNSLFVASPSPDVIADQEKTEGLIHISINNGDPYQNGLLNGSAGVAFLKGVGATDAFSIFGDSSATFGLETNPSSGLFSASPAAPGRSPEAPDLYSTNRSTSVIFALTAHPTRPVSASGPNDQLFFDVYNSDGSLREAAAASEDLYGIPDCSTCAGGTAPQSLGPRSTLAVLARFRDRITAARHTSRSATGTRFAIH